MNTPIRGRTIARQQGRIVIKTAMGAQMSFEDNGLPLFIPVLVLYDYTINQIKDVVEDTTKYSRDIEEPEDIDEDVDIERNCGAATTDNIYDNENETEEPPDDDDEDDDLYY